MKKTLLITLLGLAIFGCNDQSRQSASPVSSSVLTEQEKHPDRVYVGEHNYYVMESAVTNENWVSDDKIKPMSGQFPKYYVFNSDEWPKEDINDASSYDLPRFQFAWASDGDRYNLQIWSMKTDGTDLRLVVPDTKADDIVFIRRSPNLRYVAWIERRTRKYVYDLKTGVKTRLIGGGYPGMVWSEDSRYLYFHTMPGQNFDVDDARWDSETGEIEAVDFGIGPAAVMKDNQLITLNDYGLVKIDLETKERSYIDFVDRLPDRDILMKFRSISPDGHYAWGENSKYDFFFDINNHTVKKFAAEEKFLRALILGTDARFSARDRVSYLSVVDREKKQTWQWYALGTGEIGVNSNMSLYNGLANDGLWFKESE
ncbi:SMP-30/gluconolactonase/LRE family protein [Vibrio japonicus]|uniref:SMP-30/gluconolactonase/LRE family protein n=1 Tax=Vibrio japonicus TaxID=1824638 RepID=A0ABY5LP11_9VIBR|nr:SMP-30/gluconolactonase/LRE family protein [Vibrio japonicus]UUM32449.1 SMP-30/gluconolactonase/LRE family protein [Vibrio japonicus]